MRVAYFCFIVAACAALGGMSLGIHMGMRENFLLAPVHAHLNLLGWVTMFLFGLYYRGRGREGGWLAWTQVGAAALGFPLMTGGLAILLAAHAPEAKPLIVAGSLLTVSGMALFLVVLVRDAASLARPDEATARPGRSGLSPA